MNQMSVVVSGSFNRHIDQIQEAVQEFQDRGIKVLSPADPRIVDSMDSFLFVASDKHRSVRLVQDRHLVAISQADFLWLVAPDGYIGFSAAMELGYAIREGTPVYSTVSPPDLTARQYVEQVPSIEIAIKRIHALSLANVERTPSLLISPSTTINQAHDSLEIIRRNLVPNALVGQQDNAILVHHEVDKLAQMLTLPSPLPTEESD